MLAGCGRGTARAPEPAAQPLAVFAAQRLIVTPAGFLRPDTSAWMRQGGPLSLRMLDSVLAAALEDRGLAQNWILPPALRAAWERNRTYAADPHRLALQPLLAAQLKPQDRYGEPLSTQLRTMIALHDDARFVLVPIELRFERHAAGAASGRAAARAVLRVALLDPRFAHVTWLGAVAGEPAPSPAAALSSVVARVADLFLAP